MHVFHNAIFIMPFILNVSNNTPIVLVQNENYQLTVKENGFFSKAKIFSNISNDSISISNYNLKTCIALLLDKEARYIETNNPLKEKKKLTIHYKNLKSGIPNVINFNKESILKELQKIYDFNLTQDSKEVLQFKLFIKDSLKFNSMGKSNNDDSKVTYSSQKVHIKNGNISYLIAALNNAFIADKPFFTQIDNEQRFSIEINKTPLNELKPYLEINYGLSFKESNRIIEIERVIFK